MSAAVPNPHAALDRILANRNEVLSPAEVADILGITAQQVSRWCRAGDLPAYKLGGKWFVPRETLRQALIAGTNNPTEGEGSESTG